MRLIVHPKRRSLLPTVSIRWYIALLISGVSGCLTACFDFAPPLDERLHQWRSTQPEAGSPDVRPRDTGGVRDMGDANPPPLDATALDRGALDATPDGGKPDSRPPDDQGPGDMDPDGNIDLDRAVPMPPLDFQLERSHEIVTVDAGDPMAACDGSVHEHAWNRKAAGLYRIVVYSQAERQTRPVAVSVERMFPGDMGTELVVEPIANPIHVDGDGQASVLYVNRPVRQHTNDVKIIVHTSCAFTMEVAAVDEQTDLLLDQGVVQLDAETAASPRRCQKLRVDANGSFNVIEAADAGDPDEWSRDDYCVDDDHRDRSRRVAWDGDASLRLQGALPLDPGPRLLQIPHADWWSILAPRATLSEGFGIEWKTRIGEADGGHTEGEVPDANVYACHVLAVETQVIVQYSQGGEGRDGGDCEAAERNDFCVPLCGGEVQCQTCRPNRLNVSGDGALYRLVGLQHEELGCEVVYIRIGLFRRNQDTAEYPAHCVDGGVGEGFLHDEIDRCRDTLDEGDQEISNMLPYQLTLTPLGRNECGSGE